MRPVVVRRVDMLSPSVKGFKLACVDGAPLSYAPGQWVNLHVDVGGGSLDKRAYSIASAPDLAHPDQFEVAVTRVDEGNVSLALHSVSEGATLSVDGPYGFFTRAGAETLPALFVATGTGVCPLRAMIAAELRSGDGPQLRLLLGCRSEQDILYREEFEALAERHARFEFHATLSRPAHGWRGRTGYVQTQLAGLIDPSQRPHVYICGLSNMVNDVRATLKQQLGYDRKLLHSERYD
jgi:CDP-4-dehydro-6-deoxyglucose reductase